MASMWTEHYAERTKLMQSSLIRELLKLTQQPDIISFAGGLPAPEFFPKDHIAEATHRVVMEQGEESLQYSITEGYPALRELIIDQMRQQGVHCDITNVMITSGSQQALDLIGKLMIDEGDTIIVEDPTYLGALQAWRTYGANYVSVPTDDDGIIPTELEKVLKANQHAKFIYALPNYQNPSGVTYAADRRRRIIELSERYGVPIIEDDPYGKLAYDDEPMRSLIMEDALYRYEGCEECEISGNVIYLSTFSKTLCPGFRVAWVIGPADVISRLVQAKQGTDLHTSTFAQMVAYETARDGFLQEHINQLRSVYKARRDLMLDLFDELMPNGVTWTRPKGGLFLWVRLPQGVDATDMLQTAIEHKVAYVPGSAFHPNGGGENTMRINFSNATQDQIREGVARLATVIRQAMAELTLA